MVQSVSANVGRHIDTVELAVAQQFIILRQPGGPKLFWNVMAVAEVSFCRTRRLYGRAVLRSASQN